MNACGIGLLGAKICFFDDCRFNQYVLPWNVQCLLFDGSCVPVNGPQNVNGQSDHVKYTGTAPIFITTKLSDIDLLAARGYVDPVTGAPGNSDASMILRRLKVHAFRQRVQKPNQRVEYCPSCFARLVLASFWPNVQACPD